MANTTVDKIDVKISREQSKLDALLLRKEEILKDIAKSEKALANLKAERKTAELSELGAVADANGFSISELFAAIQSGNFYDLQEKIEANRTNGIAEETSSAEPSYGYNDNVGGSNEEA